MTEILKPINPLVKDDPEDTLTGVRDVLAAMGCVNVNVSLWDRAPAGMSRLCGLVLDAINYELRKTESALPENQSGQGAADVLGEHADQGGRLVE